MLKVIHAQEDKQVVLEKVEMVAKKLRGVKLPEAAKKMKDSAAVTLCHIDFLQEHWLRIRSNDAIERLNHEIRCRTCIVGVFPDDHSARMLVYARLQCVGHNPWGCRTWSILKQ